MLLLSLGLLVASLGAVWAGVALDRPTRQVQALTLRYFDAVERKDLQAALSTLAPEQRERWSAWVDHQTGNRYRLEGLAARAMPLLERFGDGGAGPFEAAITARITLESGEAWPRPGVTVTPLVWVNGEPLFLAPPFHVGGDPNA